MQTTSAAYKKQMADIVRPRQYMDFIIQVIDTSAAGDAAFNDNGHLAYSMVDNLAYDHVPQHTYATFEPDRWRCDGSQLVPARKEFLEQGFVSEILSRPDGSFATEPVVKVKFASKHYFPGVTLTFDPSCGDYPEEVEIVAYRDNVAVRRVTAHPDRVSYAVVPEDHEGFEAVDALDIIYVNSGKDRRRARLQHVIFGYLVSPNNDDLVSASVSWEADPITRTLPSEQLSFSILNYDGLYNPDNPRGIWRDIEERIPVIARFGQTISEPLTWGSINDSNWSYIYKNTWRDLYEGGFVEYVPVGTFYLDSLPKTSGRKATFNATGLVGLLDNEYYKGRVGTSTLYDLAVAVLQDAPVPKLLDGRDAWSVWEGLKNLRTEAPLPIQKARELLQLIASAGCCVMRTDRDGVLHIEPMAQGQEDFVLDFSNMLELPGCEKSPALGGVYTSFYSYTGKGEITELYNDVIEVSAGETVHIEFSSAAKNVVVETRADCTYQIYARAVDIIFAVAGSHTVVIKGEELETGETVLRNPVAGARDTSAWASFENPLVTSSGMARKAGEWYKQYLLLRNTYTSKYRGNPEVDVLDVITMQSRFTDQMPAHVLENKIDFNGAISGSMTLKKVE